MKIGLVISELEDNEVKKICIGANKAAVDKGITLVIMPGKYLVNNDDVDVDDSKIDDINEFMDKVNKEYGDIGKIIKINLILDKDRKFEFEKNEHILLKIIENDLKENYGLDIKEFILNDKKLNVFRSLKENNIENNSVINIII